ncbi:hypothetical protein FPT12_00375 [Pseudomonas sp. H3(2019)]|nr:hypothetical protein FPT12_00375 [Pseudomonas sp. H3(2019)]
MRRPHLQGLPVKIKALDDTAHTEAPGMALVHHELSAKNAVIPFSLSPPTTRSSTRPATFKLEQPQ